MSGWDRTIDPATGDYVDNGLGGHETTTTLATAVYHQLRTPLNTWPGDPDAGIDVGAEPRITGDRDELNRYADSVRQALHVFEADGRAANVDVEAYEHETVRGRTMLAASLEDVQSGEEIDLVPFLTSGGP